jgi:4-oxalocrotonate tautomerase family enzyme
MWEGRTVEQKRFLVEAITRAMVDFGKVGSEHLHVIIHDVPKDSWGRAGRLGIDNESEKAGAAAEEQRLGNVHRLSHLALKVSDLERSVRFYTEVVGLRIHSRGTIGDAPLVVLKEGIGLTTGNAPAPGPVDHVAFRVGDLARLVESLKAAGAKVVDGPRSSPYGNSVYFLDPDGNKLEGHDGERK